MRSALIRSALDCLAGKLKVHETRITKGKGLNVGPSARFSTASKDSGNQIPNENATSLYDSYGRVHNYLRISLSERCSFRCCYCMPDGGMLLTPQDELLTTPELLHLIDIFASLGVTAVRLTGGEPLLRKDLPTIIRHIRTNYAHIRKIGITTNGLVLERNLDNLIKAGLTHVNISLDSLVPYKFEEITRRKGFDRVLQAIFSAEKLLPTKINCVVMRGFNLDEIPAFVEMTRDHNLEVRFIEYMPFDGNRWSFDELVPQRELEDKIQRSVPDVLQLPTEPHHTAKLFTSPAHRGRWGFISSMSQAFCSSCNRLRLTADGALRSCLFSARSDELSLRDILRENYKVSQGIQRNGYGQRINTKHQNSRRITTTHGQPLDNTKKIDDNVSERFEVDELLRQKIRVHLHKKHFSHGGLDVRNLAENDNRPMITIGG
ncbi:molybdenum cofactor biosynthesis protein 1-like [Tropilaelaps mercedesae]|uniref:Molybdenum cofactor biosynthesis protein 1-like n=1 Tax=Tropilaelaps mercedesae TaxID=418985 RepID=A0A1V9XYH5_9ACAR|nr:molybdenum cofactor biosynthesis protein 1-like [Tropilaelaps mercedesae]